MGAGNTTPKPTGAQECERDPVPSVPLQGSSKNSINDVFSIITDPGFCLDDGDMQDSSAIVEHPKLLSIAICDGFGSEGKTVSDYCLQTFKTMLESSGGDSAEQLPTVENLIETCKYIGGNLPGVCDIASSGSTATLIFYNYEYIRICYLGNSKAVIGKVQQDQTSVTPEAVGGNHEFGNPEEVGRVTQAGGVIKKWRLDGVGEVGELCAWFGGEHPKAGMQEPGLQFSRCFGSVEAHAIGIMDEPTHVLRKVRNEDRFIVVATTGLWAVVSEQEAVDTVARHTCARAACSALSELASARWEAKWTGENTSIAVIYFHSQPVDSHLSGTERVNVVRRSTTENESESRGEGDVRNSNEPTNFADMISEDRNTESTKVSYVVAGEPVVPSTSTSQVAVGLEQ